MGPYEEDIVEGLVVKTLKSTDEGVAFVVEVEGKTIYFAGDLNHWHWEGESKQYNEEMANNYHKELALLPGHLDIAFVPVDPRLGSFYSLGAKDLVETVSVDMLVPMHMWKIIRYAVHYKKNSVIVSRMSFSWIQFHKHGGYNAVSFCT